MKKFLLVLGMCGLVFVLLEGKYHFFSGFYSWDMDGSAQEKFVKDLWKGMLDGEKEIQLEYIGSHEDVEDFVVKSIEDAFEIDSEDTSSDFDYMRYIHSASKVNMSGWGRRYVVTYKMEYLESREQTEEVEKRVDEILAGWDLKNMSDYAKIKKVHDYVVDHVTYDTSTKFNSPYYALVKGTSACQGYAVLIYKMLTNMDIPCRVITGKAKGGLHAWNLVKLDGKWYNLDATWDDPVGLFGKSSARYNYFLKSDMDMENHTRDPKFTTDDFYEKYPVSNKSY